MTTSQTLPQTLSGAALIERIRAGIIGEGQILDGPYGPRRITYADYTASGRSLDFMGFPPEMFTVLFALGRLPGWIAQWREMMADPATKIGRPRQVYIGPVQRPYIPVGAR